MSVPTASEPTLQPISQPASKQQDSSLNFDGLFLYATRDEPIPEKLGGHSQSSSSNNSKSSAFDYKDSDYNSSPFMVMKCIGEVAKDDQDSQIVDKMFQEKEAIKAKAAEAFKAVIANGYKFHEPVEAA